MAKLLKAPKVCKTESKTRKQKPNGCGRPLSSSLSPHSGPTSAHPVSPPNPDQRNKPDIHFYVLGHRASFETLLFWPLLLQRIVARTSEKSGRCLACMLDIGPGMFRLSAEFCKKLEESLPKNTLNYPKRTTVRLKKAWAITHLSVLCVRKRNARGLNVELLKENYLT